MILIITKQNIEIKDILHINDEVKMIDDYSLIYKNEIINFDYLICDDYKLLKDLEKTKILIDEIPVTNFYQQTSKEHIYIGDIAVALDHLYNGDE